MIKRKLLSIFLSAALIFTAVPVNAFAENADIPAAEETITVAPAAEADIPSAEADDAAAESEESDEEVIAEVTPAVETTAEDVISVSDEELPSEEENTSEELTTEEEITVEEEETDDPSKINSYFNDDSYYDYTVNADGTARIKKIMPSDDTMVITIPSVIDGYTVTNISATMTTYVLYGSNVQKVIIPASVKTLGTNAFVGCTKLKSVKFEAGSQLETLGLGAFLNCSALSGITLPESLKEIKGDAFRGCSLLSSIRIPDSVTTMGKDIFTNCSNLKEIHFPAGISVIQSSSGLSSLQKIFIPEGVTTVYGAYFNEGRELTIYYAGTDEEFEYVAFADMDAGDCTVYCNRTEEMPFTFRMRADSTLELTEYKGKDSEIVIPSEYLDIPVTVIGAYAFDQYNNTLKRIVIEDGIQEIGKNAFFQCEALEVLELPDSIRTIKDSAFYNCYNLKSVRLPEKLQNLGENVFHQCKSLTSIVVPGNIIYTSRYTFSGMDNLETVTITEGLSHVGSESFVYCYGLKKLYLPHSLLSIDNNAFSGCPITDIYYNGTEADWEKVMVNSSNTNVLNATMHFTESKKPVITQNITDAAGVLNSRVSFTVKAKNAASYQWYYSKNGTNWFKSSAEGAKTDTISLTISNSNKTYSFRCRITGTDKSVIQSDIGIIHCLPGILIYQNPVSATAKIGDQHVFSVETENAASYQWKYSKDGVTWYNSSAPGAKTPNLIIDVTKASVNNYYRCTVFGKYGDKRDSSKAVLVQLAGDPLDSEARVGQKGTFSVNAVGTGLTYQWQYSKDGVNWYNSSVVGNTTNTISMTVSNSNRSLLFRCKIADERGMNAPTKAVSFVNEPKNPCLIDIGYVLQGFNEERIMNYYVIAENIASYQWQIKVNSGEWVDYIGTDSTYSNIRIRVADFPQYSTQLRCKLTGLNGTVLYTDGGYIF